MRTGMFESTVVLLLLDNNGDEKMKMQYSVLCWCFCVLITLTDGASTICSIYNII